MTRQRKNEIQDFGAAVRSARKNLRVSQEDFAELCGVHRTFVGQVERGETNISFLNILRISTALKMRPSELFKSADL
jgi:transcriptional regulator with XRE-family HTH domain